MQSMTMDSLQKLCAQFPAVRDASDLEGLSVFTCPVRLRYVNFAQKSAPPNTNKEPRYNCLALVPDIADSTAMHDVASHAWATSPWSQTQPTNWPFNGQVSGPSPKGIDKDGKPIAGFGADSFGANSFCFSAETKNEVHIFDIYADPADPTKPARLPVDKVYPGVWGRLKVRAFAYNMGKNSGVKFWLQSFQKLADDKQLVGFDASSGYTPLAPAGAAPAQMPAAGGFGAPSAVSAPVAPNGFGAPQMPAHAHAPAAAGPAWGRR